MCDGILFDAALRADIMDTSYMVYMDSHVCNEPLINLVCASVSPCGKSAKAVTVVVELSQNQRQQNANKENVTADTKASEHV